jgi:hypothetical protein
MMDNRSNKSSSDEDDEGLDPRIQVGDKTHYNILAISCTATKVIDSLNILLPAIEYLQSFISSKRLPKRFTLYIFSIYIIFKHVMNITKTFNTY